MTPGRPCSLLVLFAVLMAACERTPEPLSPPGGSWTARPSVRPTLIVPASVLDSQGKLDFWTGMGFFRDPWVTAPASTTARDGLGPLFNAQSCIACHAGGGRGVSLLKDPDAASTIVKLGSRCSDDTFIAHAEFGRQLQTRAIYPLDGVSRKRTLGAYFPGEAKIEVSKGVTEVAFADGTRLELQKPRFDVAGFAADDRTLTSARIAPALVGLGLLEAIPIDALEALEDPDDRNGDGVSGRVHWRGHGAARSAGRFGWKAVHASVAEQTAAAFAEDMGISNPLEPRQNCTNRQTECLTQTNGNDPIESVEITRALFDRVVFFAAHIAPPPAADMTPKIAAGRRLFARAGCADCHTPAHTVDVADTDGAMRTERIWPYTDLLLHDMGDALADRLPEGDAEGREWRTPPLWGLGRSLAINADTGLLHDGRARSIAEAIVWHGGEGESSRNRYLELDAEERAALAAFVLAL